MTSAIAPLPQDRFAQRSHPFCARTTQSLRLGLCLVLTSMLVGCDGAPTGTAAGDPPTPNALVSADPTGDQFGNVALMVGRKDEASAWGPVCTGTLVAPDIVLTAAHCIVLAPIFDDFHQFGVSFAPEFSPAAAVVRALESHVHPGFFLPPDFPTRDNPFDVPDLGLLVLEREVRLVPAHLPPPGLLDRLDLFSGPLTIVGFGIAGPDADRSGRGTRRAGSARLDRVFDPVFTTEANPTASCFGDSGSPILRGPRAAKLGRRGATMILGITQNGDCATYTLHYRLDTPGAREFLGQYLHLPGGPNEVDQ